MNKVCLVVGASGAIGSAIARRFHQEGAQLALGYCKRKPDQLCEELKTGPGRVAYYSFDISEWQQVREGVRQIQADFHRLDVVVNCAGIIGPIGPLETTEMRDWAKTIEINFLGSAYLAHAALPGMKDRGGGKIILFSGGGAAYGRPFFTSYSSSKAALVRFTESLALELEASDIQVNAIAPGPIDSRMWDDMRAAGLAGGPKLMEELKGMEETGGAGSDCAARLAVFLASERSKKLTGRLLSALWDDWEHLESHIERITASEAWTLRRVPLN